MSELNEIKINKLTVEQYISVIEQKDSPGLSDEYREAVMKKFRHCTKSNRYRNPENWKEDAWTSFVAILELFRYLCTEQYDTAMDIKTLLEKYQDDPEINPKGKGNLASSLPYASYLFKEKYVYNNGKSYPNYPVFDWILDTKDEQENCDALLKGLDKKSTIEDVFWQLQWHVKDVSKEHYAEIAAKGFDVELNKLQDELQAIEAEFPMESKELIINQCRKMYDAGVKQIVFTGAPGTGKTYTVNKFAELMIRKAYLEKKNTRAAKQDIEAHIERVQFHSAYDYSDFVEGLRPVVRVGQEEMSFVRMDGRFKAFCRKVIGNGDPSIPYFFLIDEINRADLSRVFGELMYCLDENNRAKGTTREDVDRAGVATQYAGLPTYEIVDDKTQPEDSGKAMLISKEDDIYRDRFAIPENVYILATMNDIDRSVEVFDFALRRRFKWIEAKANDEMLWGLKGMLCGKVEKMYIDDLAQNAQKMNAYIEKEGKELLLDSTYQIGHAYFKTYTGPESLQDIWDTQIRMTLREYCRGKNAEKFIKGCEEALKGEKV